MPSAIGQLHILDTRDVIAIHESLCRYFDQNESDPINPRGVRSMYLLESATSRQSSGAFGQLRYPEPLQNACSLMYGVCMNHPFHNGNKRTALVCLLAHLFENKLTLRDISHDKLYQLTVDLASHALKDRLVHTPSRGRSARQRAMIAKSLAAKERLTSDDEMDYLCAELSQYVDTIERRTIPLSYRSLKKIIERYGFRLGEQSGNQIEVIRSKTVTTRSWFGISKTENRDVRMGRIPAPGDSRPISEHEIRRIRDLLGLTEDKGVDSKAFFGDVSPIDELIASNARVLRRLQEYDRS